VRFVDTNVLLYAISTAPDEAAKATAARAILESADLRSRCRCSRSSTFKPRGRLVSTRSPTSRHRCLLRPGCASRAGHHRAIMLAAATTALACHISYWDAASSKPRGPRLRVRTHRGPRGRAELRRRPHREPVQNGGLTRSAAPPPGPHTGHGRWLQQEVREDTIGSGAVPVVCLTEVFRQARRQPHHRQCPPREPRGDAGARLIAGIGVGLLLCRDRESEEGLAKIIQIVAGRIPSASVPPSQPATR